MTYLIYLKNDYCACQKSFAICTDGVLFQIILPCFALSAVFGALCSINLKKSSLEKKVFFAPIHQNI